MRSLEDAIKIRLYILQRKGIGSKPKGGKYPWPCTPLCCGRTAESRDACTTIIWLGGKLWKANPHYTSRTKGQPDWSSGKKGPAIKKGEVRLKDVVRQSQSAHLGQLTVVRVSSWVFQNVEWCTSSVPICTSESKKKRIRNWRSTTERISMVSSYRGSPNLENGKETDEEFGSCEQLATMPISVGFPVFDFACQYWSNYHGSQLTIQIHLD